MSDVKRALGSVARAIVDAAKGIGSSIIEGIGLGISGMKDALERAISTVVSWLPEWARALLQIGSPSRVFMMIGKDTAEGFIVGMETWFGRDAPRMSKLLRQWVDRWSEDLDGGKQGVDLSRLPSWAAWKLPLWMLRGKTPPGGGAGLGLGDTARQIELLKPPGPSLGTEPIGQRGYTVWNPPGTTPGGGIGWPGTPMPPEYGPGGGLGWGRRIPSSGREPGPLRAEGELELTGKPVLRITFGKRELEVMADELVALIEARLKLAASPGTP